MIMIYLSSAIGARLQKEYRTGPCPEALPNYKMKVQQRKGTKKEGHAVEPVQVHIQVNSRVSTASCWAFAGEAQLQA